MLYHSVLQRRKFYSPTLWLRENRWCATVCIRQEKYVFLKIRDRLKPEFLGTLSPSRTRPAHERFLRYDTKRTKILDTMPSGGTHPSDFPCYAAVVKRRRSTAPRMKVPVPSNRRVEGSGVKSSSPS